MTYGEVISLSGETSESQRGGALGAGDDWLHRFVSHDCIFINIFMYHDAIYTQTRTYKQLVLLVAISYNFFP